MIKTCFSPRYYADTPSASMRKLPLIAKEIESLNIVEILNPDLNISDEVIYEKLKKLHDPNYVDEFISGNGLKSSSQGWPWTNDIKNGVLSINKGQLIGTELAIKNGISSNIAQGFHHSVYEMGMGFCTFNGLALVAQEFPDFKVGVLDCDEHFGNGTADFTKRLNNLYNYSIFGSRYDFRYEGQRAKSEYFFNITNNFNKYIDAVNRGLDYIQEQKVNLIIYQAGMDCHINDPYGHMGLTTEQLSKRDSYVFKSIKELNIPVLFVMAGGYQEPMKNLVDLHVNTFKEAYKSYYTPSKTNS